MILLPNGYWNIQTTKNKGRGIFATKDIDPGTIIGDYTGVVVRTADVVLAEKDALYLMYYDDDTSIYPANLAAPGMHLVNHACFPNCWIYVYKGHTLFFALRHIFTGEELTISYLLNPKKYCTSCTHTCVCGASKCTQTMHLPQDRYDRWRAFSENESAKTKRARVTYGKELLLLATYPSTILDHPIYTLSGCSKKPSLERGDKKLPTIANIRKLLRKSGRTIFFSSLNSTVVGVQDDEVIVL